MEAAIAKIKQLAAVAKKNAAANDRARLETEVVFRPGVTNRRKKEGESRDHTEVKRNKTRQKFHKQIHSEAKDESDQDQAIKKVVKQRNKKDGQVVFAKKDEKEGKPNQGQEVMESKRERTRVLHEAVINAAHKFGRSGQAGKPLAPHQKVRTHNFKSMGSVAHFFKHKVKGHDAPRASVTTSAAYEHYCKHCDDNNAFPHPMRKFHQEFTKHVKMAKIGGRGRYVGIKLVESIEEQYDSDFAWKKAIRGAKGKDRAALISGHKAWAANKGKPQADKTPKVDPSKPASLNPGIDAVDMNKRRNAKLRGVHSVINTLPSIHRATHGAMLTKLINSKDSETMKHISNDDMGALKNHIAKHVAQSKKRKPYLG